MKVLIAALLFTLPAPFCAASCFDTASACSFAAEPAPEPPPPAALSGRPVVISIVGVDFTEIGIGKLELSYIKKIIEHFRPGKAVDMELFESRMAAVAEDAAMSDMYKVRQPDDYLDARLAEVLPGGKYDIVPIRWSRDPDESDEAVPVVMEGIRKVFAQARREGRPVYLVAHSWGTVLAHTALHRLAVSEPEVRIDKLLTLGSPLVPGQWWLKIFMKLEISAGDLQRFVAKPANVGRWVNLWARNDYFSNEIGAADRNLLEDEFTPELESRVKKAAAADVSLAWEAARDLFFLKGLKTWHFAYIYDFNVFLRTLRENHDRVIFAPVISQELAY